MCLGGKATYLANRTILLIDEAPEDDWQNDECDEEGKDAKVDDGVFEDDLPSLRPLLERVDRRSDLLARS